MGSRDAYEALPAGVFANTFHVTVMPARSYHASEAHLAVEADRQTRTA